MMEDKAMEEKEGTRDFFIETLAKTGWQYEIDEEGDVYFNYQGENFVVGSDNTAINIHIYDICWGHVELYDTDGVERLKKAVNESNITNNVTTFYIVNEAGSNVEVHSKSTIIFIPEIPNIVDYLCAWLNEFFKAHRTVHVEMAKLKEAK